MYIFVIIFLPDDDDALLRWLCVYVCIMCTRTHGIVDYGGQFAITVEKLSFVVCVLFFFLTINQFTVERKKKLKLENKAINMSLVFYSTVYYNISTI